ncbi:phosphatidate cytidylyltransferase [Photobacterium leiognathi]|uniref:phosphatidate cytidylyltransferase n=1 Tax=Photobacterium leiognathi TaxID=553611 RepID=UPI001EDF76B0|nr:phosphatidate cytidylyltransferase [Photobacterium leiognathi]MCG3884858.1 phosphatidate cytidylyltransferase [Photobacterium leiognathi]
MIFTTTELIMITMMSIVSIAIVASHLVFTNTPSEMKQRIKSWWIMQGVLFIAISYDYRVFIGILSLGILISIKELFNVHKKGDPENKKIANKGTLAIFFLLLLLLTNLTSLGASERYEFAGLILFLLLNTQLSDVLQYCFGKTFGKHKLCPSISPNKTIEGALGGIISVMALSYFAGPEFLGIDPKDSMILSLILSVLGIVGDLLVSKYKRYNKIKDMGDIIPGHGGVLDRIDSLLISSMAFTVFLL